MLLLVILQQNLQISLAHVHKLRAKIHPLNYIAWGRLISVTNNPYWQTFAMKATQKQQKILFDCTENLQEYKCV